MSFLRSLAERALLHGGALLPGRKVRNGTVILAYHGIRPPGEAQRGERSLHVAWDRFLAHMAVLQRCATVVSLEDVLDGEFTSLNSRPRVAITFDDAYEGAVKLALPELARRGWPSTVFVPTALLGARAFWWDQAADAFGGALPGAVRDCAIDECAGDARRVGQRIELVDAQSLPWYVACADEAALLAAANRGQVTLAPHTANHLNVAAISEVRFRIELEESIAWCDKFECGRSYFAFPYGRWLPQHAPILSSAGIRKALRVDGGWLCSDFMRAPMAIPRLNIPANLSAERLELGLRGFGIRS